MKQALKKWLFALLGKHPESVVVSIASGDPKHVTAMVNEAVKLMPGRRHFLAGYAPLPSVEGVTNIELRAAGAPGLWWQLRAALSSWRIGMMPVLFDDTPLRALRLAAFLRAPGKVLAYNKRLERHHLQLRTALASLLFWRGVALDRIYLRPGWLGWTTADRTVVPDRVHWLTGRETQAHRRKIGVLSPFIPYPLSHGGAVRLDAMLRQMARDFDIYLFAFRENERIEDLGPISEYCAGAGLVDKPRYREPRWSSMLPPEVREYKSEPMRKLIEEAQRKHRIELVQVEYTQLAQYAGDILVEHDVTYDLYNQVRERERTLRAWWDWWRWHRFERAAVRRFRRVVTMSEKDSRMLGIAHTRVIPNGVDLERFVPGNETNGSRFLFVGSFRHFPNAMAYRFFLREVWPVVKREMPAASLTVVSGPDPELYWQAATGEPALPAGDGATLFGFVRDVRPLYVEANIVVTPTLVSAGTNIKVLEAMAMGRALLTTPSGCGGIPVVHQTHAWIASGAGDFAAGAIALARDAALRARLAGAARNLVASRFDWATLGQMQRELVHELLPERVRLREGTNTDIDRVRSIQFEALPSSRWEAEAYLQHEFYVAEHHGAVEGFLVARQTSPDEREILNVAVSPDCRGLGLGSALLRQLLGSYRVPGDVFLEVRESNEAARRLYERLGFKEVGRRKAYYDDPVETAIIMRINLPK